MDKKNASFYDETGKLFVNCAECDRGKNGTANDKCACGFKFKKTTTSGCFSGILIPSILKNKA